MVTTTDRVTSIMVKRRYLPRSGTAREVGGIISARSKKNTVSDSRMLMDKLTWQNNFSICSVKCFLDRPFLLSLKEDRTQELRES